MRDKELREFLGVKALDEMSGFEWDERFFNIRRTGKLVELDAKIKLLFDYLGLEYIDSPTEKLPRIEKRKKGIPPATS